MLTTAQIEKCWIESTGVAFGYGPFARAIESAATAPLLARIEKQQDRIDQLIQEVAMGADVEAAQRTRIAELERQLTTTPSADSSSAWLVADGLTRDNRNLRAQLVYAKEVIEQRNAMLSAVYSDIAASVLVPKLLFAQAFNAIGLPPSPELTRIRQDMNTLLEDMLKAQQIPDANSVVGPDDQRYSLKA